MATTVLRDAESVSRFHTHWNQRIDQLASGDLGEEDFVAEMMRLDGGARDYPWAVIAIMDRRVRRGQLAEDLFRGIETRIAQREFALEAELTVDLPAPPPRIVTQRIRQLTPEELAAGQSANDAPALPVPVVSELAPGTVLNDRYVIRSVIGEGGMGRVYQALDRQRRDSGEIESHVAVKVLHERTQDHPQALQRLTREFETTRKLNHRNVIRVFEIGRDGPLDFFTMEFLSGEVMSKFLARFKREPLPRDEAWGMIRDIGSALTHAHAAGAVHGDLQPQNIMMLKSGELKLMDFGAGAALDINQVTPGYAALEQLAGLPPEPRDDLYALACLSYELLAGTHPYGHRRASEAQSLGLIPEMPRGLTVQQEQQMQQALAFERAGRPTTVREWLEGLGLETPRAVATPRTPPAFETLEQDPAPLSPEVAPVALTALAAGSFETAEPAPPDLEIAPRVPAWRAPMSVETVDTIPAPLDSEIAPKVPAWRAPKEPDPAALLSLNKLDIAHPRPAIEPFEAAPDDMPADAFVEPTIDLTPHALRAALPPAAETLEPSRPTLTISEVLPAVARPRAAVRPARSPAARAILWGVSVLLVVLCAVLWYRHSRGGSELPPVAATPPPSAALTANLEPAPVPAAKPARLAAPAKAAVHTVPRAVPTLPGGTVALNSKAYRVVPGGRFAEIKVNRSDASKPLNFVWWTEDGTARAGVDYLATPKSTAFIATGAHSVSLFVKTAGKGTRKKAARFTVLIARPSVGVLGDSRATVTLEAGR